MLENFIHILKLGGRSVIQDSSVWIIAAPLIFRINLHFMATNHAETNAGEFVQKFKENRYLAYYTLHLATFISAWILFFGRYLPDFMILVDQIFRDKPSDNNWHHLFGLIDFAIFALGVYVLWFDQKFSTSEILTRYINHNSPSSDHKHAQTMLGPKEPPICSLSTWRLGFLILSIVCAFSYPLVIG
jgi:hypothetical protein